jgi:hypothetical protein
MKRTTITHPDGSVTTVQSRSNYGCGALFTVLLALFVIAAPAYSTVPRSGDRAYGFMPSRRRGFSLNRVRGYPATAPWLWRTRRR